MDVHRRVLADRSRFFAAKLLRRDGVGGEGGGGGGVLHSVEICDCDDVEVYVEAVVLMYCDDLRRKLVGEEVSKVLGLLKVMLSCLCFVLISLLCQGFESHTVRPNSVCYTFYFVLAQLLADTRLPVNTGLLINLFFSFNAPYQSIWDDTELFLNLFFFLINEYIIHVGK